LVSISKLGKVEMLCLHEHRQHRTTRNFGAVMVIAPAFQSTRERVAGLPLETPLPSRRLEDDGGGGIMSSSYQTAEAFFSRENLLANRWRVHNSPDQGTRPVQPRKFPLRIAEGPTRRAHDSRNCPLFWTIAVVIAQIELLFLDCTLRAGGVYRSHRSRSLSGLFCSFS
jgi:hypothetical protein